MARKSITKEVEMQVLVRSKRRCCLCYFLDRLDEARAGQIAHIDQNSANPAFDNLAWLCLEHHDRYDSRTSQSKGISADELRHYRNELYKRLDEELQADGKIRVSVKPTLHNYRPAIEWKIENLSKHAIRVEGYRCGYLNESDSQTLSCCVLPHGAKVLHCRDQFVFVSPLPTQRFESIQSLAIEDSDGRSHTITEADLKDVIDKSKQLKIPAPIRRAREAADAAFREKAEPQPISLNFTTENHPRDPHKSLVALVSNEGEKSVVLFGYEVCWEYEEPASRPDPGATGPYAYQKAGSFSTSLGDAVLHPSQSRRIRLTNSEGRQLIEACDEHVMPGSLLFKLFVDPRHCWVTTEDDGFPEACARVAASVAAAIENKLT